MVTGYHYHHGERVRFFGDNEDGHSPYLGVELEVDSDERTNDIDDISDVIEEMFPRHFIWFERDGSLSYGFENITAPATYSYHESIRDNYMAMFRKIVSEGLFSYNIASCGMHVHVNRDYFTSNRQIENLLFLFDKYWDNIVIFSRRSISNINSWASRYSDTPHQIVQGMGSADRYRCVNLSNTNTIEFRVFKGTLNPDVFFATLAFVDNICRISKYSTNAEIRRVSWDDIVPDSAKDFWEKVKNRRVE